MKKLLTLTAVAMIGLAGFSGCSKSSSSSPSYSMKATVGSTAFSATYAYSGVAGTLLSVYGFSGSGTTLTYPNISIAITNYTGTGTYTCDSNSISTVFSYNSSATAGKLSKSGSIVITSATSTVISGTFSGTMTDGTAVSGGTFTAKKS